MPDQLQKSLKEALTEVRSWLEEFHALGLHELEVADLHNLQPCPPGIIGVDRGGISSCRHETLEEIRIDLGECQRCPLVRSRSRIIYGEGPASARIAFIGSAPGRQEEVKGRPLASELYDHILFAMGLERSSIYSCHVVMCRPDQRPPREEEISSCLPFLHRQLATIDPQVIVTMGEVAARALTGRNDDFRTIRGQWSKFQGIDVMPTYDPAYLLQHPQEKREAWNDLKEVMRRIKLMG